MPLPAGDQKLVQIVDAALAEAGRKSGEWLVCHPGCTQCCVGAFAISQLDAERLRDGLRALQVSDPQRASRIRERVQASVARLAKSFPGDPETGILGKDEAARARFTDFADDEPCPVLDPETGKCDLYSARPMTCRTFGPPTRSGEDRALGVCELCYHGATDEEIAACEMVPDPDELEPELIREVEEVTGVTGETLVAFCLAAEAFSR
ncbi:MAG TPA: YkgJ family cysteine cluster protein [Candidatus Angelobacter sp.]|nr:YkgJ family cysteine cluster protein [Candidatus Angelobacter sp.]